MEEMTGWMEQKVVQVPISNALVEPQWRQKSETKQFQLVLHPK